MARACARLVGSGQFQALIVGVIVANAIVIGLQTYDGLEQDAGDLLNLLNEICLGIFVVELILRIAAYGRRPQNFFKDGWNVFDFCVIGASFLPGLRGNATLLRIVRLLRVVRVVSVLPDVRVLLRGMVRSLPPIGSMAVLAIFLIYIYGMVGWMLFGNEIPDQWGNVGQSMLTLFIVLTLESWPDVMEKALDVHPQSWIFFVSFVLMASFLLINILIAVLINALEEARQAERAADRAKRRQVAEEQGVKLDDRAEIEDRLVALRHALDDLEEELEIDTGGRPLPRRARGMKI